LKLLVEDIFTGREYTMLDIKLEETGRGVTLTLYGDITIQRAPELKTFLLEQLAAHSDLTINLSYVTGCDLSLLQLIFAAHKRCIKGGGIVRVSDCSTTIHEMASSGGFLRTPGSISDDHSGCLWQCKKPGVKHE